MRWGLWAVPFGMACSSMEVGEGQGGRHMEGNAYHVNLFKYCDMDTQLNHKLWVALLDCSQLYCMPVQLHVSGRYGNSSLFNPKSVSAYTKGMQLIRNTEV